MQSRGKMTAGYLRLSHLQGDSPQANQGCGGKMRLRLILPQNFLKLLLRGQHITPVFSQIA